MYDTDPDVKRVVDVAKGLEGLRRQDGIHAAAVVITKEPLTDYLPIQRKPEAGSRSDDGAGRHPVRDARRRGPRPAEDGLPRAAQPRRHHRHGRDDPAHGRSGVRHRHVPLDDQPTFDLLARGDTIGVFQLESPPMRALLRAMAPTSFDDVGALIALYRPGPMSANMHYDYADRKNDRKPVEYFHPDAEELLADTYGLMIYQESVMRVAQKFAGYSLAEADNLRKAWARRAARSWPRSAATSRPAARRQNYGRALGEQLFDVIAKFADYAFNKSHSYGYGLVTYQTAYLKAHYPVEYMACLLTSVKSSLEKAAVYLSDCRAMGISVLTPDVNRSQMDFAPADRRRAGDHVRALGRPQRRRGPRRAAARRTRRERVRTRASTTSPSGSPKRCSTSARSSR